MKRLFLAWRDPQSRSWFPIGRLTLRNGTYEFQYTNGATHAEIQSGFQPLPMFPEFDRIYESEEQFPLFANRAPASNREDYFEVVEWLNLPKSVHDPLAVLARTGGRRATDAFEVFPCPEPESDGTLRLHFFAHGIAYLDGASVGRIEKLKLDEQLLVMWDLQNQYDSNALALRTNDTFSGDRFIVGYCPRYLTADFLRVASECEFQVRVERLNPAPAPREFRLLCCLTGCWPADFRPCSDDVYLPIVDEPNVRSSDDCGKEGVPARS